jgi:hypothetical protein
MKYTFIYFFLLLTVLSACDKKIIEPPVASDASISLRIVNKVGLDTLALGEMKYTNAEGNQYQVDILKYYISNIVLVKEDGTEWKAGNHDLIDAEIDSSAIISLNKIPNGTYKKIRFFVGVDSLHNHTGAQEGDLNPIYGMIWTWNTGYIFFKHEGYFKDNLGALKPLTYHFGTDRALTTVEIPITAEGLSILGENQKLYLNFDLNSVYASPNTVNFINNNNHQSTSSADYRWIDDLKANFADAFLITK